MNEKQFSALSASDIFRNIDPETIIRIIDAHPMGIRKFHREGIISFQGDEYGELMIILSGEITAEILSPDGKRMIIETLKSSSAVAAGVLFAEDNTLPVTLKASGDVEIGTFSRRTVLKLCMENEIFLNNYMRDIGNKVIFLAEKVRLFRFKSINQKLAGYLLNLQIKQGGDSVRLTYSLEELADLFGVARPSLSRILSEFYSEGVLEKEGRIIHILDSKKLELCLENE